MRYIYMTGTLYSSNPPCNLRRPWPIFAYQNKVTYQSVFSSCTICNWYPGNCCLAVNDWLTFSTPDLESGALTTRLRLLLILLACRASHYSYFLEIVSAKSSPISVNKKCKTRLKCSPSRGLENELQMKNKIMHCFDAFRFDLFRSSTSWSTKPYRCIWTLT